jgi:hypothetical protein
MFWMKMTSLLAIALAGCALTAAVIAQQAPVPPKEEKKAETPLENVLRKWAEADENVREMHVRFTKTTTDRTFDQKIVIKGQASIKKPDLGRVDLRDKDGRMETIWVLESKRLHSFDFGEKTERIMPFPIETRPLREDNELRILHPATFLGISLTEIQEQFRWSVFGPQARDISPRFNVRLAKEDKWYLYLDITPRNREKNSWFYRGRVVLNRDGYHVRQLWLERANGDEVCTDYLDIRTNPHPPITRESILKGLPKGWKRLAPPVEKDGDK